MTASRSAPQPVLYLAPPDPGWTAGHGLVAGPELMADLLLSEVSACAAAVGHRLHVMPRPDGPLQEAVAAWSAGRGEEPILVLVGVLEQDSGDGDGLPDEVTGPSGESIMVLSVALDGAASSASLPVPTRSRLLCRFLALSTDPRPAGDLPGRALVLVHVGPGACGDASWPGLSWGLALLLGGPGRGVLMDLQGPEGGLRGRLRTWDDTRDRPAGVPDLTSAPVPGPALASRLPVAGGVRWWGPARSPDERSEDRSAGGLAFHGYTVSPGASPGEAAGPAIEAGLDAAIETFPMTVLDAGRNLDLAAYFVVRGTPLVICCGPDTDSVAAAEQLETRIRQDMSPHERPTPVVWLQAPSAPRSSTRGRRTPPGPRNRLAFDPGAWSGTSPASWSRAVRQRSSIDLAARLAPLLVPPGQDPAPGSHAAAEEEVIG